MKTIAGVAFILHVVMTWSKNHTPAALYLVAMAIAAAAS